MSSSREDMLKGIGMMCWYSDVHHEVTPVTSGYRWVLTYNLAYDLIGSRPTAVSAKIPTSPKDLRKALRRWLAKVEQEAKLSDEAKQAAKEAEEAAEKEKAAAEEAEKAATTTDAARADADSRLFLAEMHAEMAMLKKIKPRSVLSTAWSTCTRKTNFHWQISRAAT